MYRDSKWDLILLKKEIVLTNLLIMPMNVPYMPFNPTNEKVTEKLLWDGCLFTMLRNRALEWSLLTGVTSEFNCLFFALPRVNSSVAARLASSEETCYAEREAVTSNPVRTTN